MIDADLPERWPDGVLAAVGRFKQGSVIEGPPFFYALAGDCPIWRADAELGTDDVDVVWHDPEFAPPFGILTSQTCDIAEEGDPRKPWVQAAPVYECPDNDPIRNRDALVPLTGANLPSRLCVADLRIEFPLEKGLLARFRPLDGFATEEEYVEFGRRLGRQRQRAALGQEVHRIIRETMQRQAHNNRRMWHRIEDQVHRFGLRIREGSRLAPAVMELCVVSRAPLDKEAHDWFERWWERASRRARELGVDLLPVLYVEPANLDLVVYDNLIELDLRL